MRLTRSTRLTQLAAMLSGTLLLAGCAGMTATSASNSRVACGVFKPITWSEQDTDQTIREAKSHNAAGKAIGCWE